MKLAQQIKEIPFNKNSVITVGTFDGVHLAHQKIIKEVVVLARKRNGRSVVVTFEPHPREVVGNADTKIQLLTTLRERQELCEQFGVDWLVVINFDKAFSNMSFRDFYVTYLIGGIGMNLVVEGYDHHWGRNREGTIESLLQLGKEFEFDVVNIEQFIHNGSPVNSSIIRNELNHGMVEDAAELLGRPYALRGKVVAGDGRGRLLGYPTANIELDSQKKLIPDNGIYFVKVDVGIDKYFGMASIGVRPTFHSTGKRTIEVNILDFNEDVYGSDIQIGFLRRMRNEFKYDSAEQLIQQMHKDKELSRVLQHEYKNIE
ncbi:MAG: bifunctional riboflavin kinase/FAD synthetase [Bacteroidota bacterium]|jgi:riboflavin kinase/FMN adenylyltransferase